VGDQPETRPNVRGFDESAGIMYSNDMWAAHPENPEYWGKFPLRFWENGHVVIDSVKAEHQKMFTTWFTEKSVDFIKRHKDQPFFLYVPHPQPHVPLFCSDKFEGKSGTGLYGDVIMEIDWSVGQIMKALKDNGLEEKTLIVFTSDNGPWTSYGNHSGQTPFREAKASSFDGGTRSPLIIKYPGHVEANTISHNTFFSIDFFPTFCYLTGASLPEYEIDGKNIWDLIIDIPGAENPHPYYAITTGSAFEAIMTSDGKWKLHLPHNYRNVVLAGIDGIHGKYQQLRVDTVLYDMVHDPYEKNNVYGHYPEVSERLIEYAEQHKEKYFR
jgi:arylsulfatase A